MHSKLVIISSFIIFFTQTIQAKDYEIIDDLVFSSNTLTTLEQVGSFCSSLNLKPADSSALIRARNVYPRDVKSLSTYNSEKQKALQYLAGKRRLKTSENIDIPTISVCLYDIDTIDPDERVAYLAKQELLNLERVESINNFKSAQLDSLNSVNKLRKKLYWDNKNNLKEPFINLGTQVCSYKGNKVGFVEAFSEDNYKILWKASVPHEADGFYFGNMQYSAMSETVLKEWNFKLVPMNDLTWDTIENIGFCVQEL